MSHSRQLLDLIGKVDSECRAVGISSFTASRRTGGRVGSARGIARLSALGVIVANGDVVGVRNGSRVGIRSGNNVARFWTGIANSCRIVSQHATDKLCYEGVTARSARITGG